MTLLKENILSGLFFESIRVAIGTQDGLSRIPTKNEWAKLYKMAEKQSLLGICFAGLQNLGADANEGFARIGMNETQYLNWMGMAFTIQEKNELVNRQCVELQTRLSDAGIHLTILKGQGIAKLYGDQLRPLRQSGDIDIYVDCGREKAIQYAREMQGEVDWDYKHLHLKAFEETEVEMHYVPEVFLNLRKNSLLQRWFADHREAMFEANGELVTPRLEFNLFYIMLHTYRHFLYEGVGMRQLMDYYFVLKSLSNSPTGKNEMRSNTLALFEKFGMLRFVKGVMWIMKDVFGLSNEAMICSPDEIEGRFILDEVMAGGNFGKHDKRLKSETKGKKGAVKKILKHNLHLLAHYPGDVVWAPVWIVYHWCWKRLHRV